MVVEVSDDGVRRVLSEGRVEELSWDDLGEVRVITTADGPIAEDVFFVLIAADGARGVVVPQTQAAGEFLERLQRLPGFDNAALIRPCKAWWRISSCCGALTRAGDNSARAPTARALLRCLAFGS